MRIRQAQPSRTGYQSVLPRDFFDGSLKKIGHDHLRGIFPLAFEDIPDSDLGQAGAVLRDLADIEDLAVHGLLDLAYRRYKTYSEWIGDRYGSLDAGEVS